MKYSKIIHLDPEKTTPVGFARYAEEFFLSSIIVERELGLKIGAGQIPTVPSLYLIGHSIELALKAYVLTHKNSLDDLISLGHDLERCYQEAQIFSIGNKFFPTQQELGAFELLDNLYSTKQLEYIVSGNKNMPLFSLVQSFSNKLLLAVFRHVGYPNEISME